MKSIELCTNRLILPLIGIRGIASQFCFCLCPAYSSCEMPKYNRNNSLFHFQQFFYGISNNICCDCPVKNFELHEKKNTHR